MKLPMRTPAPIIVSALLDADSFAWLDGMRRAHFPAERNFLDAHLTLFHALPPSLEPELKGRLSSLTRGRRLTAQVSGFVSLGRGVAVRIVSSELVALRGELAEAFHGLLTPQDAAPWRPHVTIQNKVTPAEARDLLARLSSALQPRRIEVVGLAAWWYRCGPWEPLARFPFR
jgi:2'-5' RNA ligase